MPARYYDSKITLHEDFILYDAVLEAENEGTDLIYRLLVLRGCCRIDNVRACQ
jgi:hypothetical protein